MAADHSFPTFCHIGEYGESGYKHLHRMIAVSQPLNLWAPTSALLENPDCQVPPKHFLNYVQSGYIRVFGREDWLDSETFRNKHPFPGAAWNKDFDGKLRKMMKADESKPRPEQRVVAAQPESGMDRAEELLAENPGQISYWNAPANQNKIPAGTLEAARRYAKGDPERLAQSILRDAWNHGEASRDAEAEVRFLLTLRDRQFLDVLMEAASGVGHEESGNQDKPAAVHATASARRPVPRTISTKLTEQLLGLLDILDTSAPRRGLPGSLHKFLGGKGHKALVSWLNSMCEQYKYYNTKVLDNAVINELRADLSQAEFGKPLHDLVTDPGATSVGAIGLTCAIISSVVDPVNPVTIGGIFGAAYPVFAGSSRAIGLAPPSFNGPQWPFLYTYGRRARQRQFQHLLYVLRKGTET